MKVILSQIIVDDSERKEYHDLLATTTKFLKKCNDDRTDLAKDNSNLRQENEELTFENAELVHRLHLANEVHLSAKEMSDKTCQKDIGMSDKKCQTVIGLSDKTCQTDIGLSDKTCQTDIDLSDKTYQTEFRNRVRQDSVKQSLPRRKICRKKDVKGLKQFFEELN